ncbi:7TM diverse intracellular signaling domain-containing protein [Thermoflexibacter ruber]|nr:7TM diverse intracellular signaling domain-containing protein [Thermoflexibacter ruber]
MLPLRANSTNINLKAYLSIYSDFSMQESLNSIIQHQKKGDFKKIDTQYIIFGGQVAYHWTHFVIDYQDSLPQTFYLVVDYPILNEVHVYFDGKKLSAGADLPLSIRESKEHLFVFPLEIKSKKTSTIFIQTFKREGVAKLPVSLYAPEEYQQTLQQSFYLLGGYFVFLLLTILINLGLFVVFHEKVYGFYAIYISGLWVHQFNNAGFASLFWGENYHLYLQKVNFISLTIFSVSFLQFAYHLLNPPSQKPFRFFQLYVYYASIFAFLLVFPLFIEISSPNFKLIHYFITRLWFICSVTVMVIGMMKNMRQRNWIAYYFALSLLPMILITFYFNLRDGQVIRASDFLHYGLPLASTVEIILLFVALLYRLKYLQKEKEQVLKKLQAIINQEENLTEEENLSKSLQELEIVTHHLPTYFQSKASEEELAQSHQKLIEVMQKESPYLDATLTLGKLASKLFTTPHQLSQVINQIEGKNFNDFINEYRVRLAQEKLKDEQFNHLTIESIGKNCGFSSKSTFYAAFKKFTQTTPTEYRKMKD